MHIVDNSVKFRTYGFSIPNLSGISQNRKKVSYLHIWETSDGNESSVMSSTMGLIRWENVCYCAAQVDVIPVFYASKYKSCEGVSDTDTTSKWRKLQGKKLALRDTWFIPGKVQSVKELRLSST